jgi:hypothetical protein
MRGLMREDSVKLIEGNAATLHDSFRVGNNSACKRIAGGWNGRIMCSARKSMESHDNGVS